MSPVKINSDDVVTPIDPRKSYIVGLLGLIGLAGAATAFWLNQPLVAAFALCAGLSVLSLALFLRSGKQSYNASCLFFVGFTLFGIGWVAIGLYILIRSFLY